jgi:hypothetical protein
MELSNPISLMLEVADLQALLAVAIWLVLSVAAWPVLSVVLWPILLVIVPILFQDTW